VESQERAWRTWSDLAQRAIVAYVVVDLLAYAALPGGTSWNAASMGGFWLFIDALLFRAMRRGSRFAVGTSFAIAMFAPIVYALTVLPIAAFNGVDTHNVAVNLAFGLIEAVLIGIAMGCEDRDESQANGRLSGTIERPHSTQ
jgi:hypothetical protein